MTRRIAIFGAGMAGLSAAAELARAGHEVHVYESSPYVGGLAASFTTQRGLRYDLGPHYIFSSLARSLGIEAECAPVPYYEGIYFRGKEHLFPFGLARYADIVTGVGFALLRRLFPRPLRSLSDFFVTFYGRCFAERILIPLIEKWSGEPAGGLSLNFAYRFLPPTPGYILDSLIKRLRGGTTEDYYQPGRIIVAPHNGCASLWRSLLATPRLSLHLDTPLFGLTAAGNTIVGARVGNQAIEADAYVSTVPLTMLARLLNAREAVGWARLKYRGLRLLVLEVARPKLLRHLWTWFPEGRFPFYRIAEYRQGTGTNGGGSAPDPALGALRGSTVVSLEFGYDPEASAPTSAEELLRVAMPFLEELYALRKDEILSAALHESPAAYPVSRKATADVEQLLGHATPFENLFLAGRTGLFRYSMLEGTYKSGKSCAAAVTARLEGRMVRNDPIPRDRWGVPRLIPE